jgi:hypothetical protein
MVKQKKVVLDKTKNKAKAKKQFIRNNSDDDDEVEDMMAWGNKK